MVPTLEDTKGNGQPFPSHPNSSRVPTWDPAEPPSSGFKGSRLTPGTLTGQGHTTQELSFVTT